MDDIVKAALAKWPNVPHCHDWLGLDARGDWYMRDDRCQAAGPFCAEPGDTVAPVKGSRLLHDKLIAFIGRNYLCDDEGQWFFQNGPQRVFVELESTPWIWRVQPGGEVLCHTGTPSGAVRQVLLDEQGRLYLVTERGLGLVHTADMIQAAERVESGEWEPIPVQSSELPQRGAYVRSPARRHKKKPVV